MRYFALTITLTRVVLEIVIVFGTLVGIGLNLLIPLVPLIEHMGQDSIAPDHGVHIKTVNQTLNIEAGGDVECISCNSIVVPVREETKRSRCESGDVLAPAEVADVVAFESSFAWRDLRFADPYDARGRDSLLHRRTNHDRGPSQ